MTTLTIRRISSKVRALSDRCATHYDQVVGERKTPTLKFWELVDEADEALGESLRKRPITALEIDGACNKFFKAWAGWCARVKK